MLGLISHCYQHKAETFYRNRLFKGSNYTAYYAAILLKGTETFGFGPAHLDKETLPAVQLCAWDFYRGSSRALQWRLWGVEVPPPLSVAASPFCAACLGKKMLQAPCFFKSLSSDLLMSPKISAVIMAWGDTWAEAENDAQLNLCSAASNCPHSSSAFFFF